MGRSFSRIAGARWIWGLLFACLQVPASAQNVLTTFAGTDWVFPGNGKPALSSPFSFMESVTLDPAGRLVFADPGNQVVVRVENSGSVRVLAGNGLQHFSGDGGAATSAALDTPYDAAYDRNGNLYVVDSENDRIRMVGPDGTIKTVAGNGLYGFNGDNGQAVNAKLNGPVRIAVDALGNVYFSDSGNFRIRKVATNGVITTFAGNGKNGYSGDNGPALQASLTDVEGMAFDSTGNLYFSDSGANRLRKVDTKGIITTVAGDGQARFAGDAGPASQASLSEPTGVFVDSSNNIYLSDNGNLRIRKIDSRGMISTIAGTGRSGYSGDGGPALQASFAAPYGIIIDARGNILIADRDNHRVRAISPQGMISTVAGNGAYRFFPDGAPLQAAFLYNPAGVSVDNNGNVYIADTDNNRIRMIDSSGTVSTVAGTGAAEAGGDNGPAKLAGLAGPTSVAPDNSGNLYVADTLNSCIRKIFAGTITTVAGVCGKASFSGDGGLAVNALLDMPQQAVPDSAGNLYISDWYNNAIRKVGADKRISTIAGGGPAAFRGDGGPASGAGLSGPSGILLLNNKLYIADCFNARIRAINFADNTITTVAGGGSQVPDTNPKPAFQVLLNRPLGLIADTSGNIFFSDGFTNQIFKLSTAGMVMLVAGNGQAGFSGDGGPPAQGTFSYPYGLAFDSSGNLLIADGANSRLRVILSAPPALNLSSGELDFSANSNGALTDTQNITITSSVPGLVYAVSTSDSWIQASNTGGSLPATIQASADPTGLQPGDYQGTIRISATGAPAMTITVRLAVASGQPPQMTTGSTIVNFSFSSGSSASTQSLAISNAGGGTANFTASIQPITGGNWLTVAPAQGQVIATVPTSITLQADPGNLGTGTYTSTLTLQSDSGQILNIPATMTVSASGQVLVLSQAGLKFTAVAGGTGISSQPLAIANGGQGTLNWSGQTSVLAGIKVDGSSWLSIGPASGSSIGGATDAPHVDVGVDASGLAPGQYFGRIQINAPGAANNPQFVTVALEVLPAGSDPGPDVLPAGLIFTGVAGASPGSQLVTIQNAGTQSTGFSVSKTTTDGQNWLLQAPANGTASPGQSTQVIVQPDFTNLPPDTYNGALTLAFADGTVRTVNILSIVSPSTEGATLLRPRRVGPLAGNCSSATLSVQWNSPVRSFVAVVGQATNIQVQVVDACGNLIGPANVKAASVQASFSNQDPDLTLNHVGNGVWTGTWRPVKTQSGQGTITVTAFNSTGNVLQSGRVSLVGSLVGSQTPAVTSGGVQNAASLVLGAPVAPGALITLKGVNLADGDPLNSTQPLPTILNGTQVLMGASYLPLLYSATGQVNVQIPYNIPVNTQFQVTVQRDSQLSVPEQLVVSDALPGIFTTDTSGSGTGVIFRSDGVTLALPASCSVPGPYTCAPAVAGESVRIYCTGLGTVTPAIDAGVPPTAPLPATVNSVSISIGGQNAPVTSSTLAPGQPGAYIVTATVPNGVSGSNLPVTVTVGGQTSPQVTMAVQ